MERRNFLRMMVGGIVTAAAVRTFPFRVFSFPSEIDKTAGGFLVPPGFSEAIEKAIIGFRSYSAKISISQELLEDSRFRIDEMVLEQYRLFKLPVLPSEFLPPAAG